MAHTYAEQITLVRMICGKCGVMFAVPEFFQQEREEDGGTFYCPNGHPRAYKEPEVDRLRRQLKEAKARAVHADDQRQAAERSASALRGQLTKVRKRVGNGVCPCCNRHFANLGRHMTSKHPGYADEAVLTS